MYGYNYNYGYNPPPPPPTLEEEVVTHENKIQAVLCYFNMLFLVPLLTKSHERSPFVKQHLNQAIGIYIGSVASGILLSIVMVFSGVVGALTEAIWLMILGYVLSFAPLVFVGIMSVVGIVYAATGEKKPLPLFGKIRLIK